MIGQRAKEQRPGQSAFDLQVPTIPTPAEHRVTEARERNTVRLFERWRQPKPENGTHIIPLGKTVWLVTPGKAGFDIPYQIPSQKSDDPDDRNTFPWYCSAAYNSDRLHRVMTYRGHERRLEFNVGGRDFMFTISDGTQFRVKVTDAPKVRKRVAQDERDPF